MLFRSDKSTGTMTWAALILLGLAASVQAHIVWVPPPPRWIPPPPRQEASSCRDCRLQQEGLIPGAIKWILDGNKITQKQGTPCCAGTCRDCSSKYVGHGHGTWPRAEARFFLGTIRAPRDSCCIGTCIDCSSKWLLGHGSRSFFDWSRGGDNCCIDANKNRERAAAPQQQLPHQQVLQQQLPQLP